MALKPPEQNFVHTAADLTRLWCDLMGPGGFSFRSLWMIFIHSDGQMAPVVSPIEELPPEPDELTLHNLREVISNLTDDADVSAAFLLSRPGPSHVLTSDRRWAGSLVKTLGPLLSPWPIHLATYGHVRVIAPDDLIAA